MEVVRPEVVSLVRWWVVIPVVVIPKEVVDRVPCVLAEVVATDDDVPIGNA